MTKPRVDVVCVGSIVRDGNKVVEAHSTCTLVRGGSHVILVDTSDAEYRDRLIEGLAKAGVRPVDVDILVNTHSHYDHNSNNDLFPKALLYAHPLDRPRGKFNGMEGPDLEIDDSVRLVHTPGHTPGSISVFVKSNIRIVIAGDAVPTEDNVLKDLPPAHHIDREQAVKSLHRIIGWAEKVVPGHGPAFLIRH
jgi:N-acyl homoserine lactone hydrolase